MRVNRLATLALLATTGVAFDARVSAHRLDEYLQAARIAVEPDRVRLELTLTPGVAVADSVLREMDADGNGTLSEQEQRGYARRVLDALDLRIDTQEIDLELTGLTVPEMGAMRSGDGGVVIQSEAVVSSLPTGAHRLFFRNGIGADNSVYLANALVPDSEQISVVGQTRDNDQRDLTIEFVVQDKPWSSRRWAWLGLAGGLLLAVPLARRTRIRGA